MKNKTERICNSNKIEKFRSEDFSRCKVASTGMAHIRSIRKFSVFHCFNVILICISLFIFSPIPPTTRNRWAWSEVDSHTLPIAEQVENPAFGASSKEEWKPGKTSKLEPVSRAHELLEGVNVVQHGGQVAVVVAEVTWPRSHQDHQRKISRCAVRSIHLWCRSHTPNTLYTPLHSSGLPSLTQLAHSLKQSLANK